MCPLLESNDERSELFYSSSSSASNPDDECIFSTDDEMEIDSELEMQQEFDFEDEGRLTIDRNNPSTPIYEGAEVTILESYLMAFQFSVRHSLTKKAFSELLQLISVHLPKSSSYPRSINTVKKILLQYFPHISPTVHTYCPYCLVTLPSDGTCTRNDCPGVGTNQFVTIPLGPQLKHMMEGVFYIRFYTCILAIYISISTHALQHNISAH